MDEDQLYLRIAGILDQAHTRVARTLNTAMVQAYWQIGREIVLVEQRGATRAGYGERLLQAVASRLTAQFGRGVGVATLRRARAFYAAFPDGSAIAEIRSTPLIESGSASFSPVLGWSHYLTLLRVRRADARAFYEIEAARERWSVRELERQIGSLQFERSVARRELGDPTARSPRHALASLRDVVKEPFVLEFLGLGDQPGYHERDLEQAIIDRLGEFLLELGRGFCFVARQKRITVDGDHFYVDLVFYNRLLRAFVLIDLKLGKLTPQDLGQLQFYVNFYDQFERAEHEARTIGIVLCSDKNDAMVQIALPPDSAGQIIAARYQTYLPTEDELRAELIRGRDEIERVRRLTDG